MRLNVFLARCRVASRRGADALIAAGRVTVNGDPAALGRVVDPERDEVRVDGKSLEAERTHASEARTTILLHKPAGYLVSRRDRHHRHTVYDLLPEELHHLVPVGRLDLNTEGALLMTDDGQLVERLTHPRFEVEKVYVAEVDRLARSLLNVPGVAPFPGGPRYSLTGVVGMASRLSAYFHCSAPMT